MTGGRIRYKTRVNYLLALFLISACRAGDLYLTWRITPDLRFELNPIVRWMGWRWNIVVNVAICSIAPLMGWYFILGGCFVSVLAIAWNFRVILKISKNKV